MMEMDSWQEKMRTLQQKFSYIFEQRIMCDCCFEVGQEGNVQQILAHRLVLSVSSCKFKEMFGEHEEEITNNMHLPLFRIPDVQPETFMRLLKFTYSDDVDLDSYISARDLLLAAFKYRIMTLVDVCVDAINEFMCPKIVLNVLELALNIKNERLEEQCLKVIQNNTSLVLKSDYFETSRPEILKRIYESDYLKIENEMELYTALLRWARSECDRRDLRENSDALRDVSLPFLQKIRFLSFTTGQVEHLRHSPLLKTEEVVDILLTFIKPVLVIMPNGFATDKIPRSKNEEKSDHFCCTAPREYEDENNNYVKELKFEVSKTITIVRIEVPFFILHEENVTKGADRKIDFTLNTPSTNASPASRTCQNAFGVSNTTSSSTLLFGSTGRSQTSFGSDLSVFHYPAPVTIPSSSILHPSFTFQTTSSNIHSEKKTTLECPKVLCVELIDISCENVIACKHLHGGKSPPFRDIFQINAVLKQRKKYCIKVIYLSKKQHDNAQQIKDYEPRSDKIADDNKPDIVEGNEGLLKYDANCFVKSILYKTKYPCMMQ